MDNRKLLQILMRDAGELEQLIGEIRQAGSFDPLGMELLQTRISGIKHMLEVAGDLKEAQPEPIETREKPVPVLVSFPDTIVEPAPVLQPEISKKIKEKKKEPVTPVTENQNVADQTTNFAAVVPHEAVIQNTPPPFRSDGPEDDSIASHEKHILAEKFVAGKSLNDILLEKSRTDPKFSSLPLNSLATGIGTNERFLFTRELFDGNMDNFNDTVHKLDSMHTIQEAIDFLSENFKWGKSETSLRFIDLIKRRFIR